VQNEERARRQVAAHLESRCGAEAIAMALRNAA
jgi:hypothetical protein